MKYLKILKGEKEELKSKAEELKCPVKDIRNLLGEYQYIPIKTAESFNGNYIKYKSDGYTYLQHFSLEEHLEKMKKYFKNIIKELRSIRYLWKIFLVLEYNLEYCRGD